MKTPTTRLTSTDRRQQILDQATKLFARRGYEGTTTRQIARQAGINEALIFRHFGDKDGLYWAIIEQKCQMGARRAKLMQTLDSRSDDRTILATLAETVLRRNFEDSSLARLLLFSALENHRLSRRFFRVYVAQNYDSIAAYIRRRVRQGKFRGVDAQLAARGFLGMVVYHFWIQEIFGGKRFQKFDLKKVSNTLADIWLRGMRSSPSERSRQEARKSLK
ncbi:MAG: TetR/AcrR family transcriptional regulator [Acidobacteriia bacterium]|nr:TetR/AcrR family transcriptional regulator [Terriglobia bacterium]